MGRTHRNAPRTDVTPEEIPEGEGREIGLSARVQGTPSPIPGGETHLVNPHTARQRVAVTVPRPEFGGMMAHGVPPGTHTAHERAEAMRGPNDTQDPRPTPHHQVTPIPVPPVPVTIVQTGADLRPLRSSSHRRYLLPAAGGAPVRIVGRNASRDNVRLLNEDSSHHIRFAQDIGTLNTPNSGTVLPATTSSYLKLETQDELYAISDDSGTPYISIIEEFDRPQSEVQ